MEARWGKRLGRYEIVAELGRGAMGVVYKARDPKIERFVAVKTISLLGASPDEAREYRERFFQEAQAAGRLLHPGIVTVFDVGEEPESRTPYMVMEYIAGQSLDALLSGEGGKPPLNTALQLTEELAEALDYAHAQGVVHRDIKPANILVTTAGHPKITDFGIAKLNLAHLTLPGRALGTPAYMSPEQLNGERVDGRSDLFSLGVILYGMVSGHRPFQGNSVTTVCFKLVNHDPVPPTAFDPNLPAGLDAVIARAIAKDPAQRYQRGVEFALDMRELRERALPAGRTGELTNPQTGAVRERTHIMGEASGSRRGWGVATGDRSTIKIFESARSLRWLVGRRARSFLGLAVLLVGLGLLGLHRPTPSAQARAVVHPSGNFEAGEPGSVNSTLPKRDPDAAQAQSPTLPSHAARSSLAIRIDHPFAAGKVSVWVDGQLACSRLLHGETKKHLVFLRSVQGHDSDKVVVAAGQHRLRVRVQSSADAYDHSKTIAGSFAKGDEKTLRIRFDGPRKEIRLVLK
jgi:eukaryotic-like serine/threonine-protein kinase